MFTCHVAGARIITGLCFLKTSLVRSLALVSTNGVQDRHPRKAAGVYPNIVQERLGHSSISLTLDTCSYVLPGMGREAASKFDALLLKAAGEAAGPVVKSWPTGWTGLDNSGYLGAERGLHRG